MRNFRSRIDGSDWPPGSLKLCEVTNSSRNTSLSRIDSGDWPPTRSRFGATSARDTILDLPNHTPFLGSCSAPSSNFLTFFHLKRRGPRNNGRHVSTFSNPLSAKLAKTGLITPPCGVPVSLYSLVYSPAFQGHNVPYGLDYFLESPTETPH
jgi:hypothetical protein